MSSNLQTILEEFAELEDDLLDAISLTGQFQVEIEPIQVKFFTPDLLAELVNPPFVCILIQNTLVVIQADETVSSFAPNFTKQHPNWTNDEKLCAFFSDCCTARINGCMGKLSPYTGKLPVRMDDYDNLCRYFIPWHHSHPAMFEGGTVSFSKGNNFDVHLWYWYQSYPQADRSLKLWS